MHDDIRTFSLTGEMVDTNLVNHKERLIGFIETMMRDDGCVPVLDLEPQFSLEFDWETERYKFELTLYGVKVVEGEEWRIAGLTNGKKIMKYIPNPKSKQF